MKIPKTYLQVSSHQRFEVESMLCAWTPNLRILVKLKEHNKTERIG
ncbi:MAG: hypothetical protein AAF558_03770 [Verrucomicrobiota bacterium]